VKIAINQHISFTNSHPMVTGFQYAICCLLLMCHHIGHTQQPISLSQAVQLGLEHNYDIRLSKVEQESVKKLVKIKVPEGIPSIRLNLDQTNRISVDGSPTSFVDGTYSKSEIAGGLDLNWVLFHGYKVRINRSRLTELENQSNGNLRLVVENTVHAIVLAYYKALIEKEKLQFRQEVTSFSVAKLDNATIKFNYGEISQFELLNFQDAQLRDSVSLMVQQNFYQEATTLLKSVLGIDKAQVLLLTDSLDIIINSYDYPILKRNMLSSNQEIRNQLVNIRLQETMAQLAEAELMPKVALRSGLSEELSSSKFSNETQRQSGAVFDYYLNFSVTYQLFNKRDINTKIQKEQMNRLYLWNEKESMVSLLEEKLKINYDKYNAYRDIIKMNERLEVNLKKTLDIAAFRFESGISSFLELRDVQIRLIEAKLDLLEAAFELKVAETEIIRLTGGILNAYEN